MKVVRLSDLRTGRLYSPQEIFLVLISEYKLIPAANRSKRDTVAVGAGGDPPRHNTVIPRLTKIIRSGITFVSRNVISRRFL